MTLPLRFIAGALLYLLLGSGLGMAMAVHRGLIGDWRSIHAHLNVNGFLSMLIYGMSYLFAPGFSRRRLARPEWVRWHLWAAHAAVWGLVVGRALRWWPASALGGLAQVASSLLFVAVIATTIRRGEPQDPADTPAPLAAVVTAPAPGALDRAGTLFTRLALIYLVVASLGGAALAGAAGVSARVTAATIWFTVTGFVVMMVSGVAYHLIPRLNGRTARSADAARWQFGGLAAAAPALAAGYLAGAGNVIGLAHLIEALALGLFAWNLWPALDAGQMPRASRGFVRVGLVSGFVGAVLAAAAATGSAFPLPRPVLLHLHLLGLATMTAFGVTYALIQADGALPRTARWPLLHLWIAALALAGMVLGLIGRPALLAVFGPLQFLGVAGFLVTAARYRLRSGSHP